MFIDLRGYNYPEGKISEELVDKATIVRAVAYDKNGNCSKIVTKAILWVG